MVRDRRRRLPDQQSRDDEGGRGRRGRRERRTRLTIGDDDAPHEIVIYEDFLCPICRALEAATRDQLAELADEGKVRVSYRPFNLLSRTATRARTTPSRAAGAFAVVLDESGPRSPRSSTTCSSRTSRRRRGPFPSERRPRASSRSRPAPTRPTSATGIENGDGADWVEEATAAANDLGINSTPTIFLDGEEFRDGRTMEELAANLVAAVELTPWHDLARDRPSPSPTSSPACRRPSCTSTTSVRRRRGSSPSWPSGTPAPCPRTRTQLRAFFEFRDFAHFVEVYLAVVGLIRTPEDVRLLTYEVAREMAEGQSLRYAELDLHAVHLGGQRACRSRPTPRRSRTPGSPRSVTSGWCCAGSTTSRASPACRPPTPP